MKKKAGILIVEDDPLFREYLCLLLDSPCRKLHEAGTAIDALYLAHMSPPEMLIIDIGLRGDFDGFALLKALRQDGALAGLPVVVVSGHDKPDVKSKAMQLGATSFLSKPIDPQVLLDLVAELEGRAEKDDTHSDVPVQATSYRCPSQ